LLIVFRCRRCRTTVGAGGAPLPGAGGAGASDFGVVLEGGGGASITVEVVFGGWVAVASGAGVLVVGTVGVVEPSTVLVAPLAASAAAGAPASPAVVSPPPARAESIANHAL
jgi:hypothetical protein